MRGNWRWRRAWKRPAAAHSAQVLLYCKSIVSQQLKYIWLSACRLLLPCGLDFSVCFQHAWINLSGKVDEWIHERLSSRFFSSRRVEHLPPLRLWGCKAKSHVVSTWFLRCNCFLSAPSPMNTTWAGIDLLQSLIKEWFCFVFLAHLTHHFLCKTTISQHFLGAVLSTPHCSPR